MKKILIILLFCCLIFSGRAGDTLRGRALWIIDGDNFYLKIKDKVTNVRLWGIDAPEKDQQGGKAASANLNKLIGRKMVTCEIIGYGAYKRPIVKVYYKKELINLKQVVAGYAWHSKKYAPKAKEIAAAEKAARQKKAGIWKYKNNIPPWTWRKQQKEKRLNNKT